MSQSADSKKEAMAQTTSAAQQGDNIAHALAGAGGGLLSMTLTLAHPPEQYTYYYVDIDLATH